jgi:predicted nucleotidyltransferase
MTRLEEIKEILRNLKGRIRQEFRADVIGFFGSYARGDERAFSDLDLLVRFQEGATLLDMVGMADFLEDELQAKVDIVPIDTLRPEIRDRVFREVVYL